MSTEQFNNASTPAFPTGYGQFDTHAEILSSGKPNPSVKAGTPYGVVTSQDVTKMVKEPPSMPKDKGQWFIPSTYSEHDARTHEVQQQSGVFRWLTLDVDCNNLDLDEVVRGLHKVVGDVHWLIYSSRGATEGNKKWRALVPLKNDLTGMDFADTQTAFFDLLEEASDGTLIPDAVFARPAQLVYLPNRGEFYEHEINKGAGLLDLTPDHKIIRAREAMRAENEAVEAAVKAERDKLDAYRKLNMQVDEVSPIEHFNAEHSVSGLLARYGYQQKGASDNWRSPMQQTKGHATRDYGDYWVSLSGSDGASEIGAPVKGAGNNKNKFSCRFGDAFDLYVYFKHANDRKAAVRTYAKEAGLNRQREAIHKANDLSDFEVVPTLPTQEGLAEAKREDQPKTGLQLDSDAKGNLIANVQNYYEIMSKSSEWEGVLAYNEFTNTLMLLKPIPTSRENKTQFKPRELRDSDITHARRSFRQHKLFKVTKSDCFDAMQAVAQENVISPVKHYLEGLGWDGVCRLETTLTKYAGADDTHFNRSVGKKWMIGAVARALEPGCKNDTALVLDGPQGVGKSTFARVLASDDWFYDGLPDLHSKDAAASLRGKWIIELQELSAMKRSDVEAVKAFLSRTTERFRPAYERTEVVEPRRCAFIGTTNRLIT